MAVGRRRKQHFGRIHAFSCGRASFKGDHSLIGGPGFSRVVYCNEPSIMEAIMSELPNIHLPLFSPTVSNVLPLVVVIGITMGKEALEDWKRKKQKSSAKIVITICFLQLKDIEVNNRKVKVHHGDGVFDNAKWRDLKVGDIVKVQKDEFFPADLILLSSSYEEAICYVETMNLDGETNLKLKQALDGTSHMHEDSSFQNFKAVIKCEDPNANLYSFVGGLHLEEQQYPLSPQQLLLRDSKLRNTDFIYGVVIFTGNDTKVMQNSTDPPSKRSKVEKRMDKLVYFLFFILVLLSFIGSIFFGISTSEDLENGTMRRWYLRPDDTTIYYDPKRAPVAAILHFLTAIMLYSYLIPISLYVSIEIVKVLQSGFINRDMHMYYEEADKPARARTSNLNEELGQVDTILSDKTGTLTCNSMEFIKCSVAGTAYGHGVTEVERALAGRKGSSLAQELTEEAHVEDSAEERTSIKGFNFIDERVTNGNWVNEPKADIIQKFLRLLAICHTAIPEVDEQTGRISYEAESPDEAAFVIAARELGFEFYERTQTSILLHEIDAISGGKVERCYELLNVLEFSSSRKRMSVIVRNEDGKLLLLCKGADSVMLERLAKSGREFEEKTKEHINEYADAGLRTLVLAYRELNEDEYNEFNMEFTEAKNSLSADLEDKLQNGVPECIDKLAQAGIKLWVLTGDKMETAINIGFACSLLRQGMKQIVISSETPEVKALEKDEDKSAVSTAFKASVLRQISGGKALLTQSSEDPEALALIIDGKSLTCALEDDVKDLFLELALGCASVICCRSSPKQKALVARLVKIKTGNTTLAIGDGANDVGMLQEADIGVGISGVEGMQAVMSSDIAIAQFRYLERLLLVHGHWCYRRMSSMAFSWECQAAYNDWYLTLYNVVFTSLAVIAMGVFDQDVSARLCVKFPLLYQEGVQNVLFSWFRILGWAFNGVISATLVFFFCIRAVESQAFRKGGEVVGMEILGTTMYTCVVWLVNCQMALPIHYFTYILHFFIWGGIIKWYIFLLAYGSLDPSTSTTAYKVFIEACAPAPFYWLLTLLVVISCLIPYFTYASIQLRFFPMYHQMIQCIRTDGQSDDLQYCKIGRQRSLRPTTVGYTARFEASKRFEEKPEGSYTAHFEASKRFEEKSEGSR
ncbi:putative phospholipid-transporting ATPase 9 [Morella rubra]|uniref:Phospholipid-transporting ATPase n=1 Tax=Morella rubra TaxID=262757 RepID=A0A6A1VIU8_9ROSI|nr:putative phospholipid-transporting ATPase 9 [Morella rubra]